MKPTLLRASVATAAALSVVAAGAAVAAPAKKKPAPVCQIVSDDKGDATASYAPLGNQPAWDVVTADIATDAKTIIAVIRVDKLAKTVSASPTGSAYRFNFEVAGVPLYLQANTTPFGDRFTFGYVETTSMTFANSQATGVFDLVKNEVRVSALLAAAESKAKMTPGTRIVPVSAQAGEFINTAGGSPSLTHAADLAEGGKTYMAGTPSCVAVGK